MTEPSQLIDACTALDARREEIKGRMRTIRIELQAAITEARGLEKLIVDVRTLAGKEQDG